MEGVSALNERAVPRGFVPPTAKNARGHRTAGDLSTLGKVEAIGEGLKRSRAEWNKQGVDLCSKNKTSLVSSGKRW